MREAFCFEAADSGVRRAIVLKGPCNDKTSGRDVRADSLLRGARRVARPEGGALFCAAVGAYFLREMLLKQLPQAENFVKFAMVSPFRLMKRDVAVLEIDRIFKTQNLNAYEKSLYQCRFVFIVPWQRVRFLQG